MNITSRYCRVVQSSTTVYKTISEPCLRSIDMLLDFYNWIIHHLYSRTKANSDGRERCVKK